MEQYIKKSALVAEIDKRQRMLDLDSPLGRGGVVELQLLKDKLKTLEVKEVDFDIEKRIKECPFRQVACNRYEDTPVECDGRCSWVCDYPKLKELKALKSE